LGPAPAAIHSATAICRRRRCVARPSQWPGSPDARSSYGSLPCATGHHWRGPSPRSAARHKRQAGPAPDTPARRPPERTEPGQQVAVQQHSIPYRRGGPDVICRRRPLPHPSREAIQPKAGVGPMAPGLVVLDLGQSALASALRVKLRECWRPSVSQERTRQGLRRSGSRSIATSQPPGTGRPRPCGRPCTPPDRQGGSGRSGPACGRRYSSLSRARAAAAAQASAHPRSHSRSRRRSRAS
jgi:hypothetical protein